ncbi:MAG: response regulator [Spirochaetaceae bacterium]|nr:MAG: response regulator [Spirochaetaceae bacterium]
MKKILIVDDDHDLREGQKIFLEGKGYEVQAAGGMEEGLEALKDFTPNLILVDLMMEHLDAGFVFCAKVRDNPKLAKVPIIMQTAAQKKLGFSADSYNEKARSWMKADVILTKPVSLEILLQQIERYLAG